MIAPPLVVIAGVTASGKTRLSLALADALALDGRRAEIISADSRQVYRGLDIGTAKVEGADRARVAHHCLDLVDPDVPFSVADFVAAANTALVAIAERGAVAILVGGTGFYLRAVARGLDLDALPSDQGLRAELEAELAAGGVVALARRLEAAGPRMAATVDLRNPRRVVRALEMVLLAGDRPRPPARGYPGASLWLGLDVPDELHRRCVAERARGQFDGGLLPEAAALRERFDPSLAAFSAIGYHEAWAVLDGEIDLEAAVALDARRNVAFARRQRTWFRREPGIDWLDPTVDPLGAALDRVRPFLAGAGGSSPAAHAGPTGG